MSPYKHYGLLTPVLLSEDITLASHASKLSSDDLSLVGVDLLGTIVLFMGVGITELFIVVGWTGIWGLAEGC